MSTDNSFDNETPQSEKPAAFCQNCGKPLDTSTMRVVGSSVFCEPCLAARIGIPTAGPTTGPDPYTGYTPVAGATGWTTPPPYARSSAPNPGLAALLGLIPGVGAMYNEQYAKGIVHLLVFATLVTLSHASGLFGLMIMGWEFYMVIEAHHTARARRDGTPLPNPFGLNDLSERLGFGRNWASPSPGAWPNPPAQPAAAAGAPSVPPVEPWGAPTDSGYATGPVTPPYQPPAWAVDAERARQDAAYAQNYAAQVKQQINQPYGQPAAYYPPVTPPFTPAYTPVQAAPPDPAVTQALARRNRFPAGAIWLIALGLIFLLATTGIFEGIYGDALVGFVLIGLAVYFFLKRMLDSGVTLASDGNPNYPLRVVRALRVSVWLFLIGLLIVLNSFNIVYWSHSWPWLIVVAGLMMLIERTAFNSAAMNSQYMPPPPYAAAPVNTSLIPTHTDPIVPQHPTDFEGGN